MPRKTDTAPGLEGLRKILKSRKLKATPQRIAVHQAMLELRHASADMVCSHALSNGLSITVSSVYNILEQFVGLGLYSRRLSSDNKMYFDVETFRHVHLYDTVNNEFMNVVDDELAALVDAHLKKKRFKGYRTDGIEIQILCHPTRRRKV